MARGFTKIYHGLQSLYASVDRKVFELCVISERPNACRSKCVASFARCSRSIPNAWLTQVLNSSTDAGTREMTRTLAAEVADQGKHRWIPGSC
jgi:hypothetical protein